MDYHLICVHPIGTSYKRGQRVTDPQEIARLRDKHDKRFVKVPAPKVAALNNDIMVDGVEYAPVKAKPAK